MNNNRMIFKLMKTLSSIEANEVKATLLSFIFIFILMVAYYLLRPIRDALASDWTDVEVSTLWTLNFFISTAIVAIWGFAVSRVRFNILVPIVYSLFAVSFVLFYLAAMFIEDRILIDKGFYLWVSVFALLHVSVFWSFMSDTFNKDQAKRLFSVIAAGASLGAIFGPLLSGVITTAVGVDAMMLMSAVLLMVSVPVILYLSKLRHTELGNIEPLTSPSEKAIGGHSLSGFREFFTNPYLLGIGVFIILYTGIGSFVYFEQKNLLVDFTLEERASIYGYRDAIVNTLTYILAFFITGRLVNKLGMPAALAVVPIFLVFGMMVLAFSPVLMVAVGMHVVLRSGNYGLTRPAREMLFTLVSREDRFKAKPVIDIVAYRGGDVIMGWFFTLLSSGIGLSLAAIAVVGAGIAALWAFVGHRLGVTFDRKEALNGQPETSSI